MKQNIQGHHLVIVIIVLLSSLACSSNAEPPSASFIFNVDSGSAPLTVEFLNNTQGPATKVEWDFGDGTTSTKMSPVHLYTVAGTYEVKLFVSGPAGSDTRVMTQLITVEPRSQITGGGEWITRSPIPTTRGGLAAETLSDGIHVVSGSDWDATYPKIVHEVYDPLTDTWTTK